jgi:hypothetical protein
MSNTVKKHKSRMPAPRELSLLTESARDTVTCATQASRAQAATGLAAIATSPLQDFGSSDTTRAMLPCSMSRHIPQAKQAPPQCCSVPLSPAAAATNWRLHDGARLSQLTSPAPLQPCFHVPCYQRNSQTAKITSPLRGTPALLCDCSDTLLLCRASKLGPSRSVSSGLLPSDPQLG